MSLILFNVPYLYLVWDLFLFLSDCCGSSYLWIFAFTTTAIINLQVLPEKIFFELSIWLLCLLYLNKEYYFGGLNYSCIYNVKASSRVKSVDVCHKDLLEDWVLFIGLIIFWVLEKDNPVFNVLDQNQLLKLFFSFFCVCNELCRNFYSRIIKVSEDFNWIDFWVLFLFHTWRFWIIFLFFLSSLLLNFH